MSKNTQIALFEDELAKLADAAVVAERSTSSTAFMSTKGGILSYQGNPIAGNSLEVVVIASPVERLYYASRYDPTKPSGPACYALAVASSGMKPSAAAPEPQCATCQGCPKDEWGSSPTGGKGKACRETRRILMIPADACSSAEAVATAEVAALRPPVTSLKGFATYLQTVATGTRRPLAAVVTRISVAPDPKTQFKVQFDFVRAIEDVEVIKALIERGQRETDNAIASAGMEEEHTPDAAQSSKF